MPYPFDALWFRSIVGLAVGLALGSFVTMLSYRLPRRLSIEGIEAFIAWLQQLMNTAVQELGVAHFDIPDPLRQVEARVAPPGSAAAMYYTRPSEDFSRPGRTWYPDLGRGRFPLWVEVPVVRYVSATHRHGCEQPRAVLEVSCEPVGEFGYHHLAE